MSNCYLTLKKLSLCYIVIAITSRINNIRVKYSKVYSIFLETFSMDFKILLSNNIELFELYNFAVQQI